MDGPPASIAEALEPPWEAEEGPAAVAPEDVAVTEAAEETEEAAESRAGAGARRR